MGIKFNKESKSFNLQSNSTSYILKVLDSGHLAHLYWGRKINADNIDYALRKDGTASFCPSTDNRSDLTLELVPQEYPTYGNTDLRSPAVELQFEDGSTITDLRYECHNIYSGKQGLSGLPSTYVEDTSEAETLEITLRDSLKNVKIVLMYTVFNEYDAITRSVKIINEGNEEVKILRVLSANVDFSDSKYDLVQLSGAWARERHIVRREINSGSQLIESRRGASSHAQNPFIAVIDRNSTEDSGNTYGFSFVYSGNFLANVEVDMFSKARVQMGINHFDFTWLLKGGEEFQAPEVVLAYSPKGLTGMSKIYHDLYSKRLCRGEHRDKVRPVLINNWEATYFNFNDEKIKDIAKASAELGVELFVLDDGWFGERDSDNCSLGDWFVNEKKIKCGLGNLVKDINNMGLKFGLWFEPEMVSPKSELYKEHPDWCIHVNGRTRSEGRKQLILDLSREEVCDEIIKRVCDVLESANIEYVKWDMNRNMTEIGSATLPPERQREVTHRYMLGLYRVMETITSRFPNILFESCSGGGGRFDPGMLYYMPQTWTSDDTDAIERLKIQFGTSMVYPSASMGCHVSAVPNHQVGRITPITTRGVVAMSGNFGYELDATKFTEEEKKIVKEQINLYKEIRETIQFGDFYRLQSPFEGNHVSWMFVSKDGNEVVVSYVTQYAEPHVTLKSVKLKGLDEKAQYRISGKDRIYGGDELMYIGLNVPSLHGDYAAMQWRLEKVE